MVIDEITMNSPEVSINFKSTDFTKEDVFKIRDFLDTIMGETQEDAQKMAEEFTRNRDFSITITVIGNHTDIDCYK